MSAVSSTAAVRCVDVSGNGNHLRGADWDGLFGYDPNNGIVPVVQFGGLANERLFKTDVGAQDWADILGTEAYIITAQRGLTLGCWFWVASPPGAIQYLMSKDDGANRQYALAITAANAVQFTVWPGAIAVISGATISTGWNHAVGRYDQPSQTLYVTLNGTTTTGGAGAAPAALNDTGAFFTIGANDGGAGGAFRFVGYMTDCWLCACSLRLGFIRAGYHYTKAACGVK